MGFCCRSTDSELHDRSQVSVSAALKRKLLKTRRAHARRVFLHLLVLYLRQEKNGVQPLYASGKKNPAERIMRDCQEQ